MDVGYDVMTLLQNEATSFPYFVLFYKIKMNDAKIAIKFKGHKIVFKVNLSTVLYFINS